MKKRIVWLDIIKGFLILTVMLGHISQTPEWFKIWIYSFHLPLFFFLSGVTLSIEKYDFKSFVKRKVRTLIVPGLIFDFFIIVINVSLGNLHVTIKNIIIGVILQMRGIRTDIAWFLILLFMSEIILYLVIKLFKEKQRKIIVFLFFMSALNYICLKIAGIFFDLIILPYSIDLIFMILPFVYAGYLYKTGKLIINENWTFLVLSIIMGNMLCFISFKVLGYCFDLYAGKFGSFLLYYLTAYAQINWLVIIFRKIKKAKLLSSMCGTLYLF